MDQQRIGRQLRALRQRLGWRQEDLAARCGVSQPTVSRLERGRLGSSDLAIIDRVAAALGAELDVRVRWRGEELDRLMDATHAAVGDRLVGILGAAGWQCALEVTFWIHGERGSVDLMAWHPATGRLLVVETKSVVPDMQQMLGSLDRKVRLAAVIAAQRDWKANGVGRAIVLPATSTNRRRAEQFRATLRAALPDDASTMRRWLADPSGPCPAALWFLADIQVMTAIRRRRVRLRRMPEPAREGRAVASVGAAAKRPGSGPPGTARRSGSG